MAIQYGMSEQTPAAKLTLARLNGRTRSIVRRRRRTAKKAAKRAVKKRVKRTAGNKFRKGSAAAKRHMAKLRRMVGRKRR